MHMVCGISSFLISFFVQPAVLDLTHLTFCNTSDLKMTSTFCQSESSWYRFHRTSWCCDALHNLRLACYALREVQSQSSSARTTKADRWEFVHRKHTDDGNMQWQTHCLWLLNFIATPPVEPCALPGILPCSQNKFVISYRSITLRNAL